jgi:membrane-bound ClpP family serine protease
MNTTSRTITGIAMIVLGLVLTILGFFIGVTLIYGIPLLVLGFFIFFNKKEDEIEQIKSRRVKK